MSIGLWDADKTQYPTAPLNLELMKLSNYYKSKRGIVNLSPLLEPNRYTNFFIRKDYNDGIFIPNLADFTNVEYGGYAFTNGLYVPLNPEIEIQKPDVYIYERLRRKMGPEKYLIAAFETMMRAQHLRLSLDGKTIWTDFEK